MAVFKNTEMMYDTLGGLFKRLLADPESGPGFKAANVSIKFVINDPDGIINVLPDQVLCGESADVKPDVTMTLSGDTCHAFWLKKINLPIALAKRTIKAKGPVNKVLKMLPILRPAYEMYPKICAEKGLPT
ncbi:MAG: SCP2 sterol-binding domain-containing protein [bacterium]